MSDYLGPNQTRVLDPTNRGFEQVVYQKRKPPLSSELNLTGMVSAENDRLMSRFLNPSGWSLVGSIKGGVTESQCRAGDTLSSSGYVHNTFKLIALDKGVETQALVAWVNGWRILVQGTNSTDENNVIILDEPPTIGSRIDFVFLEVWKKVLEPSDTVYKYGNILYGGINPSNDLIDPAINIETSLRVQIQYRIRVAYTDLETYPDGFDPNRVFVQGPLSSPLSTCVQAYFSPVPGDIGLWRAGSGDAAAQETLGTADGYTYAIPMFAIHRRNTGIYNPETRSNGSAKTLANYLEGYASDRPDNLYNDWIVASDILDLRRRVSVQDNYKELCEDGFKKLISGKLQTKMGKSTLGEDHYGKVLVQADAVSNVDKVGSTKIAEGDGVRRIFSNAEITQPDSLIAKTVNDKITGTPGAAWAATNQFEIDLPSDSYPEGSQVTSVDAIYTSSHGSLTGNISYTALPADDVIFTINSGTIIGTSLPITVEYTISMPAGPNGLTHVPNRILEFRKEDSTTPIASVDSDIRVRTAAPVIIGDTTHFNTLSNRGARFDELYDFGHRMTYHVPGSGSTNYIIPRSIEDYSVLGIADAKIDSTTRSLGTITRTASQYNVALDTTASSSEHVEFDLYLGTKFFETNKQGRAITETYEMIELTPREPAGSGRTVFKVDTTGRFIAIASYSNENGTCYAYNGSAREPLVTNNLKLSDASHKTELVIEFSSAPSAGNAISVPVLRKSAISDSEGYTCFYETTPYQGWLDSTVTGRIEAIGPALVTTSGSGTITDYTYAQGLALFDEDTTSVLGQNTEWASNVKSGYLIKLNSDSETEYVISEVYDDSTLFLSQKPKDSTVYAAYTIVAKDQPFFSPANILDRLPALNSAADASGMNEEISTAVTDKYPVLETRIVNRVQDISDTTANTVILGQNVADRGRSTIHIPDAPLGRGNLGLKYEKLDSSGQYQKTFQSYILDKDNDGRLYLMVAGSEVDNTSLHNYFDHRSNNDVVDIFELPGIPITMRRLS